MNTQDTPTLDQHYAHEKRLSDLETARAAFGAALDSIQAQMLAMLARIDAEQAKLPRQPDYEPITPEQEAENMAQERPGRRIGW